MKFYELVQKSHRFVILVRGGTSLGLGSKARAEFLAYSKKASGSRLDRPNFHKASKYARAQILAFLFEKSSGLKQARVIFWQARAQKNRARSTSNPSCLLRVTEGYSDSAVNPPLIEKNDGLHLSCCRVSNGGIFQLL